MIDIMFEQLTDLFSTGQSRQLTAGEYLFHRDDQVRWMFLVTQGEIRLLRYQENGNPVILQRAHENEILAEASLFSDCYHCDAVAAVQSRIMVIARSDFRAQLENNPALHNAWTARLARQVQQARLRSEILSLKTVSQRLDAWVTWNRNLPPKGNWLRLAQEIGVSPEALYREIGQRRRRTHSPTNARAEEFKY
ncbi:Crp/Fnr family transcriptional regulator [Martelella soudanensis]|uniref:Crp/Fnr family transcriptional regulator n=1 Tax=unclassified Martelella TaxID=2629616 RepID=UPI0015DFF8AB|nr:MULTISPECIES: Crp/Fnr family transcriptional regulator [unclassified Martelella]